MASQTAHAWKVLESLHGVRERKALSEVVALRQQIEQCEAREERVVRLREDYAMRLRSDSQDPVSAGDVRLAHQFLTQVDGMLDVLKKQKAAMCAALDEAMKDAEQVRVERQKYEMLADSAEQRARAERVSRDQREADQAALMLYNCRRAAD